MDGAALARWSVAFDAPGTASAEAPLLTGQTIAVARDAAFCFIYPANLDALRALGAELLFFSPLANEPLPTCDAVWLPGGYPELHADVLAAATRTRDGLRAHAQAGRPVWAECGGMMPLFDQIISSDGHAVATWGLLPGKVVMQKRLAALGPQQLPLPAGALRGHTFHYSRCETPLEPVRHTESVRGDSRGVGEAVYRVGAVQASYFHAWFPSSPAATASLFLTGGVA
jgi:cobyrinic acid a,c-diamide synthase